MADRFCDSGGDNVCTSTCRVVVADSSRDHRILLPSHARYWLHAPLSCSVGHDQVTDSDSVLKIADQLLVELRLLKKENPAKEVRIPFPRMQGGCEAALGEYLEFPSPWSLP